MKTIVAALIEKDNKYLLAKSKSDISLENLWEFPKGTVEPNESDSDALKRNILEKFNAIINVGTFLAQVQINEKVVLKLYSCKHDLGGYHPKKHSEIVWLDNIMSASTYELAPADLNLLEKITKNKQEPQLHELVAGHTYTNEDIQRIYRVSPQGGMRKSNRTNSLILFATHTKDNPYEDRWGSDGIIHYTGMGLSGDQSIDYAQNKTLAQSRTNGIDIHLFESNQPKEYIYSGRVELADTPYYKIEKDEDGYERKVVKFPLRIRK